MSKSAKVLIAFCSPFVAGALLVGCAPQGGASPDIYGAAALRELCADPATPTTGLSGDYYGSFAKGELEHLLIVGEEIGDGVYTIHYAWGVNREWNIDSPGCTTVPATMSEDGKLFAELREDTTVVYDFAAGEPIKAAYTNSIGNITIGEVSKL